MDSINKNQTEDNFKAVAGAEAIEKIKEMIHDAPVCFFCTKINDNESFSTRPMSVQQVDDEGNCWFLSANDSKKNLELANNASVQLLFQGSQYSDFLTLYGKAEITTDKAIIKKLWQPLIKAWFTEGEDDPRITAIKVILYEGYYWDTKHGKVVAMVKTAIGAMLGKTFDDSIEGNIKVK
ncbi:MAG: pyridoxamine 5'-phosphate oxidase family protein [Bacteroidota bacterium]